jgi:thiamine-monophosphate kinase
MKKPSHEYELITNLQSILTEHSDAYEIEIGDDAAVRRASGDHKLIFTTDLSVEHIHFRTDWMSFFEIGYKAMVSNISDCASMGAIPESALIQLIFNKNDPEFKNSIEEIYRGFNQACKKWCFSIIGGDLSQGSQWAIGITLIGKIPANSRALKRVGAQNGDKLWVSGFPGLSAAGLDSLHQWGPKMVPKKYRPLINAHICPEPRVELGVLLRENPEVHAMMDLSDGLAKDCRTLAFENELGIILNFDSSLFPLAMVQLSEELKKPPLKWIVGGGEEYELLFAASNAFAPSLLSGDHYKNLFCIGSFTRNCSGLHLKTENGITDILDRGWDHI